MSICSQCEIHYKSAKNPRLHLELSLLKINYLPSLFKPNNHVAMEGATGKKPEPQAKSAGATTSKTVPSTPAIENPNTSPAPVVEAPTLTKPEEVEPVSEVQTPVKAKPPVKPVAQMPSAGLAGLRSSKSVIKQKAPESEIEEQIVSYHIADQAFDLSKFMVVWNEIAQKYKDENLINKFVMMDRPIELIDTVAHIKVENEVQVQHFNEQLRMEVLGTLRERLQNFAIDIVLDVTIQENGDKKLLYTQSDKFDFLVQKHPILGELKNKLGLDHEF
jgi:DNA polymerase-3 subunit gamma/tau